MESNKWQFWIDRGGTFTDVVAKAPDGSLIARKYLSENPDLYADAAVFAARDIMEVPDNAPFPAEQVGAIKMGTTVATNALLEHDGEPTLLVTTKGLADALMIGQQHRQDLFALKPTRPAPLYSDVLEIDERIAADGTVLKGFDPDTVLRDLKMAASKGIKAAAIVLLHGYRNPVHEQEIADLADQAGFTQISVSHRVSPLIKYVPRGDTTVADAYLSPILKRYVAQVRANVGDTDLYFMQSNGGLTSAESFAGKDAILSGPAGGIVGAARMAARAGTDKIIGFDMGGTSTDVCHYAGAFERALDHVVAGVRLSVPMMDIHTVAAGGGSICSYKNGRLQVGPASAGANPGPAAYGKGGPITVTDCNVVLGKLQPDLFPKVFGPNGDQPLDKDAATLGLEAIRANIQAAGESAPGLHDLAQGFIDIAVEHMARAIKKVSIERGHDIKKYSLLSFGGAGGQHACLTAAALGIERVIIPPYAGMLSALGMGLADLRVIRDKSLECDLNETALITETIKTLTANASSALNDQGVPTDQQTISKHVRLKFKGSNTTISTPFDTPKAMRETFLNTHQKQFGFIEPDTAIIADSVEVECAGGADETSLGITASGNALLRKGERQLYLAGQYTDCAIYTREEMLPDNKVKGPAIILENGGTTMVEAGWSACLSTNDTLILNNEGEATKKAIDLTVADPIMLEVFNNLFMSVAEEMGGLLAQTAHSVNIKERLDFSCAVFDAKGNLIANAPHMPVHLGSMGASVQAVIAGNDGKFSPGSAYLVNDPIKGGTHLPDITAVTPVFLSGSSSPDYFVASRGHHADVGGIAPGSMPAFSTKLSEEGVRFDNFEVVTGGNFNTDALRDHLLNNEHPARKPDQNIADIKAQIAANARGIELINKLVDDFGADVITTYMGHIQDNAEEAVRRVIDTLSEGSTLYQMDCGTKINLKITKNAAARSATIDFTGSSTTHNSNFNAPLAVTRAAVLYVFRVLTGENIPMNEGCMKPLELIVPAGCFLNPGPDAAVVAGNVETSQAVTNALLLAVGASASAQGTMNNLTFGNDTVQYYETIAGGTGAGAGFDGTDAIQSHMTNSRLTDPEILEWHYPVRLTHFGVRGDSGGKGKTTGGNGVEREILFLEDMDCQILSSHRKTGAPGLMGGNNGKMGINAVRRKDGTLETLQGSDQMSLKAGDTIIIKTPGGGGHGQAD